MYLQQSLKGGTAKGAIEGLSHSGEYYTEAIECLQSRYNRPRLIHKTHVCMILEAQGGKWERIAAPPRYCTTAFACTKGDGL